MNAESWYKVTVAPGKVANLRLLAESIGESPCVANVSREETTASLHPERELTVDVDCLGEWTDEEVRAAIKVAARKHGHRTIWIDDAMVSL